MTLDQRFQTLAADFVVCWQDRMGLQQHAAELNECCEKQGARLLDARAIIVTLLGMLPAEAQGSHDLDIEARARDWLKEI